MSDYVPVDFLEDALDLPAKAIAWVDVEQRRWYSLKILVFEFDDRHWGVYYMEPLSELQEGQEVWRAEIRTGLVEVFPMELREVTVKRWVRVVT